jgi:plasmid maintenance system antidote protein VapI
MNQIIGYLDKKSIGYLDCVLFDNVPMSDQVKYPEFAKRLGLVWRECKDAPVKQTQMAKWLGFAQPTVNNWINGNALPGLDTAVNLAKRFGCNPIWLITGEGSKNLDDEVKNYASSPFLDKFNNLQPEQQKLIDLMLDQLTKTPKITENNPNKSLTSPTENVGGGLPVQSQQSQDRRMMTKRKPNQFEIDLAIEHERCVMVRHQEQMEANARYIELIKEKCMSNECYCEPPCEDVKTPLLGYISLIEAVKK